MLLVIYDTRSVKLSSSLREYAVSNVLLYKMIQNPKFDSTVVEHVTVNTEQNVKQDKILYWN